MLRTSEENQKIVKSNTILTGSLNVVKFPEVTNIFVICQIEICKGLCDSKCHPPFKIDPITTTAQSPSSELKLTTVAPTTLRPTTRKSMTTQAPRASTKHHSRFTTRKPTTKKHHSGLSEIEKETETTTTSDPATGNPETDNPGTDNPSTDNPATNNPVTNNLVTGDPITVVATTLSDEIEESSTMPSDPTEPPEMESEHSQTGRRFENSITFDQQTGVFKRNSIL